MSIHYRMILFAMALTAMSVVACSDDKAIKDWRSNGKLSPEERWPDQREYSYDLDDSGCRTQQSYLKKSDYCVGLTDRERNKGCALMTRKSIYKTVCGDDFEETNIAGKDWSGWDERIQTTCSTAQSSEFNNFAVLSKYCQFLKTEALHHYCHWDARFEEFQSNKCQGDFSSEPSSGIKPTPTPSPTPTPIASFRS